VAGKSRAHRRGDRPGGGDDFIARLLAPKLSESLRQQFIVDNRPGASGMIGQTLVAKSAPDGYTWLLAGGLMAGARYVNAAVTYDVLRDFTPVSLLETSQFVLVVHPSIPTRNVKEYVALARSQPGKMTFGTLGAGQIPHWSAILFNSMAGISAVEVAYKGPAEAITDVLAGRVDYYFSPSSTAVAYKARLRPLAVTSMTRSPAFPDLPTMAEAALPGQDMPAWRALWAQPASGMTSSRRSTRQLRARSKCPMCAIRWSVLDPKPRRAVQRRSRSALPIGSSVSGKLQSTRELNHSKKSGSARASGGRITVRLPRRLMNQARSLLRIMH
jgi:tripartite-type tricarboxylate transporter receptor subunit TctC